MNSLNDFWTASSRDKHYEYYSIYGHVKVKMPSEKEKWLKYHDSQYQFKVLFILYVDFEIILKPVDEQYREMMSQMKTRQKNKTPYTEILNAHELSRWCVHSILV